MVCFVFSDKISTFVRHLIPTLSIDKDSSGLGSVWFYGVSTIVGYLMPNPFYTYTEFYFKQFSLT